jgi:ABC-2 type transport system permease protein
MRNILAVFKYELYSVLSKPSFWLTTLLVPLLVIGINIGTQVLIQGAVSDAGLSGDMTAPADIPPIAYVDEAGLLRQVPPAIPTAALHAFPSRDAAQEALAAGKITQFYVIPADFVETGKLILVVEKFAPISSSTSEEAMRYLLSANLVDDPARAAVLVEPLWSVETHALAPQEAGPQETLLTTVVPIAIILIFYLVLAFTGSFMLQSVTREKENRTAEVLLVSLRPRDLLVGKVLGLAVIALAQVTLWVGAGILVLDQARQMVATAASFALPAGFFVWGLLYFLLGYLLYGSLMAGLGALAPSAREGNQAIFVMLVPLMIPLLVHTVLSLFPLTASVSMPTRLAVAQVPFWQPVVGLALLAGSAYLVILLAGRLFRADTLLSSNALSWTRVAKELRK